MKRKITLFLALISVVTGMQIGILPYISGVHLSAATAYAEESWNKEFEDICSKTNDAMSLTKEELKSLIDRCDKLKPTIEKLEEPPKKVFLKRLQMCRDLFVFVLESKEKN